ncbi:MAG: EscF/YscF/HrpA family type III secretion system needle major subunit [Pseudomonadota bacterium]|mgnify:FL=1
MISSTSSSGTLSLDYISNVGLNAVDAYETAIKAKFDQTRGTEVSTTTMLELQSMTQKWSLMTQIQSTLIKEISDAMKGVVQKAG